MVAQETLVQHENGLTAGESTRAWTYRPNVDIVETATEVTLFADMPGARADAIDIHFEKGVLAIRAKVATRDVEGRQSLLREYGIGDFHRTFQVSESIDASRISAEYKSGVLTLHLPKVEAVQPRKIEVKTS